MTLRKLLGLTLGSARSLVCILEGHSWTLRSCLAVFIHTWLRYIDIHPPSAAIDIQWPKYLVLPFTLSITYSIPFRKGFSLDFGSCLWGFAYLDFKADSKILWAQILMLGKTAWGMVSIPSFGPSIPVKRTCNITSYKDKDVCDSRFVATVMECWHIGVHSQRVHKTLVILLSGVRQCSLQVRDSQSSMC